MKHLKISAHGNSHKRQCRLTVGTLHCELRRRGEKYKQRQKDAGEQTDGGLALQERLLYVTEPFHLESEMEQVASGLARPGPSLVFLPYKKPWNSTISLARRNAFVSKSVGGSCGPAAKTSIEASARSTGAGR
jgi:hypothetical protein